MGERGFLGLKYPEALGGQGGTYLHDAVLAEELARSGSGGLAAGIGAHIGIATPPVFKFGTDDQKERYLRPAIAGREDRGAGHHRARRRLRRRVDPHARQARRRRLGRQRLEDVHHQRRAGRVLRDRGQDDAGGRPPRPELPHRRPAGRRLGLAAQKMGWHASDTGLVTFEDAFVPEENLLGRENEGFYLIMANFQWERLLMALGATMAHAGRAREDAGLREGARGVRPAADQAPGAAPQARRRRDDRAHLPVRDLRRARALHRRRGRRSRRSRWPSSSRSARRST